MTKKEETNVDVLFEMMSEVMDVSWKTVWTLGTGKMVKDVKAYNNS